MPNYYFDLAFFTASSVAAPHAEAVRAIAEKAMVLSEPVFGEIGLLSFVPVFVETVATGLFTSAVGLVSLSAAKAGIALNAITVTAITAAIIFFNLNSSISEKILVYIISCEYYNTRFQKCKELFYINF